MIKPQQIAQGIYKKTSTISYSKEEVSFLYDDAELHPRNRSRILIHKDQESIPQEMLISFTDKSIVEVSTHVFPESFTMLEGVAKYVFYMENGDILEDVILSPYDNQGVFYCFIPKGTYHRFIPYTKHSLAHEIGFSTFSSEFTTLYLDKQFKEISQRTNENYSLSPVSISQPSFDIISSDREEYLEHRLNGKIIPLSYQLIQDTCSREIPTIYRVNNSLTNDISDNIIVLPFNKTFEIPSTYQVETFSVLSGNVNFVLEHNNSINYNKKDLILLSIGNDNKLISIINDVPNTYAVLKFTSRNQ